MTAVVLDPVFDPAVGTYRVRVLADSDGCVLFVGLPAETLEGAIVNATSELRPDEVIADVRECEGAPKPFHTCLVCETPYTREEWNELRGSGTANIRCMNGLEWRNCPCGGTMAHEVDEQSPPDEGECSAQAVAS